MNHHRQQGNMLLKTNQRFENLPYFVTIDEKLSLKEIEEPSHLKRKATA